MLCLDSTYTYAGFFAGWGRGNVCGRVGRAYNRNRYKNRNTYKTGTNSETKGSDLFL